MRPKGSGKTKGSGRKKGTRNKSTVSRMALAEKLGVDPFEFLLLVVKGDWKRLGYVSKEETRYLKSGESYLTDRITLDHRIDAAQGACAYLYPKLKCIEFYDLSKKEEKQKVYDLRDPDDERKVSNNVNPSTPDTSTEKDRSV